MEKGPLPALAQKMSAVFQDQLISVVAYGTPTHKSLFVILSFIDEKTLLQQKNILRSFAHTYQEIHYFTETELLQSTDVFPIEFLFAKETGQVLLGKDCCKTLPIDTRHLRHQCEYELRTLTQKLRGAFFEKKSSPSQLIRLSLPSLMRLLFASVKISNEGQPTLTEASILDGVSHQFKQDTTLIHSLIHAEKKANLDAHFDAYLTWIHTFISTLNDVFSVRS